MARSRGWLTDLLVRPSAQTHVSEEAVQLGNQSCQAFEYRAPQVYLITEADPSGGAKVLVVNARQPWCVTVRPPDGAGASAADDI
jgi:hypothetical protein